MTQLRETPFSGLAVVVTGAGSGIGRATARLLSDAGAHVLAVGRRMDALQSTAEGHPRIVPLSADLLNEDAAATVVGEAFDKWGRLDVLINNAGIFATMPLAEVASDRIADLFATNVTAPSMLASAALPLLKKSRGTIMNVSSTYGHIPAAGAAHYGATKAAIEHLTRSWALELAPHRVRVNAIAPGPTETDVLLAAGLPMETIRHMKSNEADRVPLGRLGEADEVARWMLPFIDPAASWVTGQVLSVDGGLSLT